MDTTVDAPGARAPRAVRVYVAVASGCRRELVPLVEGETSVGRSRSCHVVVDDPAASRLQATLEWRGDDTVWVHDRGSRNGTFLAGRRVRGRERWTSGASLRIGATQLALIVQRAGPELASHDAPIARSAAMRRSIERIERAAPHDVPVLIEGETGVGKEVLARHLHARSRRAQGPFVAANCGAIPESLAEATLFGVVRGAFTDATSSSEGLFVRADGGTLFLDEVGELAPSTQTSLLRAVETGEVTPVGAAEPLRVDLRLVAATHVDLDAAVRARRFREDLLYRLAVVRVHVPPLRERPEDLDALARHFLAELPGDRRLTEEALECLRAHPFPGNVRELRNRLEAACVLSESALLGPNDLALDPSAPTSGVLDLHLEEVERERIQRALEDAGGNQSHSARALGISRRALIYRMEKLGLKPKPPRR